MRRIRHKEVFFTIIFILLTVMITPGPRYNVVMFGDSITREGDWANSLERNDVYNFGISGDITGNMKKNAAVVVSINPKICFIMGGINDLSMNIPVRNIYDNLISIILRLKSVGIIPVMQSALYVSDQQWGLYRWNEKVAELNKLLEDYCKRNEVLFIDLNRHFAKDMELLPEYSKDGIHLNQAAYQIWQTEVLKVLEMYNI